MSMNLTDLKIELPENVKYIIDELEKKGFEAFAVGGCVRDTILLKKPKDWDITTDALPSDIIRIFKKTLATGIKHGTVTVMLQKESFEVTTYRLDGKYTDGRHPDKVEFTSNLYEDLRRRDFTINAMAYSDKTGIIDKFNGISDLESKKIACVGNSDERFNEDALRILRAVRFASQLDFEIEEKTYNSAMKLGNRLELISKERIFDELTKILCSNFPQRVVKVYDLGIYKYISNDFALIDKNDCKELEKASKLPSKKHIRFAVFMSNIDSKAAGNILKELRCDNFTINRVKTLVEYLRKDFPKSRLEVKIWLNEIGEECFDELILLKEAGFYSENVLTAKNLKEEIILNCEPYRLKDLNIDGNDLLKAGVEKGPKIKKILDKLLMEVMKEPYYNIREVLLDKVRSYEF